MKQLNEAVQKTRKVVFVNHATERGGAEYALKRFLEASANTNITLIIPSTTQDEESIFDDLSPSIRVVARGPSHESRSEAGTGVFAFASIATRVARSAWVLLRSEEFREADVVVANTTRSSVYGAIAARLLRKRLVVHIRDRIDSESIGRAGVILMRQLVLPYASAVIANSRASLSTVSPYLRESCESAIIPSPAGLSTPAHRYRASDRVRNVGMIARLDPWKGQAELMRAYAASNPPMDERLVLAGGPSFGHEVYERDLKTLARSLNIHDQVSFLGHVEDIRPVLERLDICVQFSLRPEPLGQNVLQYLAAGRATIVANEGGPAEWVTHAQNGIVVPARDEHALSLALQRLRNDAPLRARISAAAVTTPGLLSDQEVASKLWQVIGASGA